MVSQYVVIGVAVGVFLAGIGIGYGVLQSSTNSNFMNITPQQMQQMMNDPNMMNQWHQTMMNDPQHMEQMYDMMMNDSQSMTQMYDMMMGNNQHMNTIMQPMMNTMMNDPQMQQQMMTHMMGHQGMMNSMMNNQQMMNMMNQGMMSSGMMSPNMMMQNWNYDPQTTPSMMMTDPEFRQQMFDQVGVHHQYMLDTMSLTIGDEQSKSDFIELMNEHNQLIGGMHTSYLDDPEIQQIVHDHLYQHHEFLQKLTGNN